MTKLDADRAKKDRAVLLLEKRAAKLERWLRAVQIVANEAYVRKVGTRAQQASLDALIACESLKP